MFAILNEALLTMKLFTSFAERYAKNVVRLPPYENFDIEEIQNKLGTCHLAMS